MCLTLPSRSSAPRLPEPQQIQAIETEERDEGKERSMWNPLWLWRTTLIGFILMFLLFVILLIILFHLSNLHNGLSAQTSSDHYSWTYGPTAG